MRVFLSILILIFSLQTWAKADDIRDFQIEGMNIGDSLLDFFSEKEILNSPQATRYKDKTYTTKNFHNTNNDKLNTYHSLSVSYKASDKKFILVGIGGALDFENNHLKCYKKQDEIINEIKTLFPNNEVINFTKKLAGSTDGSNTRQAYIQLNDGFIGVQCKKFGKELKKKFNETDHLKVDIFTSEYNYWLLNVAYK